MMDSLCRKRKLAVSLFFCFLETMLNAISESYCQHAPACTHIQVGIYEKYSICTALLLLAGILKTFLDIFQLITFDRNNPSAHRSIYVTFIETVFHNV